MNRLRTSAIFLAICLLAQAPGFLATAGRPNVILIMTDDQGYGDFGATGNQVIETPNIDAMARRSASMSTFYVSPVCSPTRACLMTGRYNYRTRCIDTFLGRSMMDASEVTIAEVLRTAGYATGIFGKWHLGDCYPMRPIDQGFVESLVHRGGGLAQPSEPRENNRRYTDPILFHNGEQVSTKGYCTDVYFSKAMEFIRASHSNQQPFFVYLPMNAPHGPFHDVPQKLLERYLEKPEALASLMVNKPNAKRLRSEIKKLAAVAAMITNVDENVGRLFQQLEQLGITRDTLVMFLVDNGPNTIRYVGPFRGSKNNVHEGGIRSPLWVHWPLLLTAGTTSDRLASHIDLFPTILEATDVEQPSKRTLDGRSLLPLLEGKQVDWPDRTIVMQAHRGDRPVRYHNFMIRDQRWKLLHASGFGRESFDGEPKFELYQIARDPGETKNLLEQRPQVVRRLKKAYEQWFLDVSNTRPDNYAAPRIIVGTTHENPTVLTRQDWRRGTWERNSIGQWEINVAEIGIYDIELLFDPSDTAESIELRIGSVTRSSMTQAKADSAILRSIRLPAGDTSVQAVLGQGERKRGVYQLLLRRKS